MEDIILLVNQVIPDEILQYKPCKCCRIRNDNGIYRVYKYSAVKLSSGKWSSNGDTLSVR